MPHLNVEQWHRSNRLFQKELANSSLKEWKNDGAIPGFLDLGTVDNLNQIILCCEGCPGHYKMFSIIPGLYPPETNNITPVIDNQKCLQEETNVSVLGIDSSMSTQIHIWVLWTEGCKDTSEPPDALVMKWDIELGTEFLFYPPQRQR